MNISEIVSALQSGTMQLGHALILPQSGDFASTLTVGQVIKGKVLRQHDEPGRYTVQFNDRNQVVDSEVALVKGETVHTRVTAIKDSRVFLKRIHQQHSAISTFNAEVTLENSKNFVSEFFKQYQIKLDASQLKTMENLMRPLSQMDALLLLKTAVMLRKLDLPLRESTLKTLHQQLARLSSEKSSPDSIVKPPEVSFSRLSEEVLSTEGQLADNKSFVAILSNYLSDYARSRNQALSELNPRFNSKNKVSPKSNSHVADKTIVSGLSEDQPPDLYDEGDYDPRLNLAEMLLNIQNSGQMRHSFQSIPFLYQDSLVEIDIAVFSENKREGKGKEEKYPLNRIIFSLQLENLGQVEVEATVQQRRINLALHLEQAETANRFSERQEYLEELLQEFGWAVDQVTYDKLSEDNQERHEKRINTSSAAVVNAVIDHTAQLDSFSRYW